MIVALSSKSKSSFKSDPAKRLAKILRWLQPFDIALPGRGRRGGWGRDCCVTGILAMAKYCYAYNIGDVVLTEGTILGSAGGNFLGFSTEKRLRLSEFIMDFHGSLMVLRVLRGQHSNPWKTCRGRPQDHVTNHTNIPGPSAPCCSPCLPVAPPTL